MVSLSPSTCRSSRTGFLVGEIRIHKEPGIMGKSMDSKKEDKKKPAKSMKEKKAEKKTKKDTKSS